MSETAQMLMAQRQEIDRLRDVILEAIGEMEDMINYVPDYFRQKWEYDEAIAKAKRALKS